MSEPNTLLQLTPQTRRIIQNLSVAGDPLAIKSFVVGLDPKFKEAACSYMLSCLYEGKVERGISHLEAVKVLIEDPRICFQPSDTLMQDLSARFYRSSDIVCYLASRQGLLSPLPVLVDEGRGALATSCAIRDVDLVKFLITDPSVVRKATLPQRAKLLEYLFAQGDFGFWQPRRMGAEEEKDYNLSDPATLVESLSESFSVVDCLIEGPPSVIMNEAFAAKLLLLGHNPEPKPYRALYIASRGFVDLKGLIKNLLHAEGKSVQKAQTQCEFLYTLFPNQVVDCIASHESLWGVLEEKFCPLLYKHAQREVLRLETKGKGVLGVRAKM